MTTPWYPITQDHPPPLVRVRAVVRFAARGVNAPAIVSRGRPPHSSLWAQWISRSPRQLGPSVIPLAWQPQQPDKWQAPLPLPISESDTPIPIMAPPFSCKVALAWWRDANEIVYEPPGKVSPRMAEGRVMRAVAVCGRGVGAGGPTHLRAISEALADMVCSVDRQQDGSDRVLRLDSGPADISDFSTAMGWFAALNPTPKAAWEFNRLQQALVLRSLPVPWSYGEMGDEWGLSGEAARKMYQQAIELVWQTANERMR